jgi:hypothetical protein
MATIFAQMQRDDIGTRLFGHQRGADRIRIRGAARVAQRGDVIDVHAQVNHIRRRKKEAHKFCKSISIWRVASGVPPR